MIHSENDDIIQTCIKWNIAKQAVEGSSEMKMLIPFSIIFYKVAFFHDASMHILEVI